MGAAKACTTARRIAGSVSFEPLWLRLLFIFADSQVLQKAVRDHRE
jgi:hypothetical protein